MDRILRIMDANLNRTAEGLRVVEDLMRFALNRPGLAADLRQLRHRVRQNGRALAESGLSVRDAAADPGLAASQSGRLDERTSPFDAVAANFKRVQEALRSLEEFSKTAGHYPLAKEWEKLRFESYSLEKLAFGALHPKRSKILETDLYCLTAEEFSAGRTDIQVTAALLKAGIELIQYRAKDKSFKSKLADCRAIREMTLEAGARFIVNDHPDLALMVQADGVHLGQDDLPPAEVRKLVGPDMAIGVSTHSPDQARAALAAGADYIGVGPIFATRTKKDVCDPVGLEYLDFAVAEVDIPFVAIGGIKEHNLARVMAHGAKCVALVTEIVGTADIAQKIAALRQIMHLAGEEDR